MKIDRRFAVLALLLAAGCGGGSSAATPTAPTTPAATRVIGLSGNLAFGNVEIGQTATKTLTITNTGNATLTVSGLAVPIGTAYTASWTGGTIAAGGSQAVTITFAPVALRTDSGVLTVSGDQTAGTNTIAISGVGVAASTPTPTRVIALSGDVAFGSVTVGATATATLTISNSGNSLLTWTGITTGNAAVTASPTSGTVPAGGSQAVTLTFAPTAAQSYGGTLTVTGDQTAGTNTAAISGIGTAPAPSPTRIINLTGNLSFGNVAVGSSASATFAISNTGNSTLTVSAISYPADTTGDFSSGTIASGSSRVVTLTFTPTAVQSYSNVLTVTSDATSGLGVLTVSGTGTPRPAPGAFTKSSPASGDYVSTAGLTLTWRASAGATSYEYCYQAFSAPACSNWISSGTSLSASVTGLENGVTYYWNVRAVNSTGTTYADGAATAMSTFTTASAVLDHGGGPAQVTLNVSIGSTNGGSFDLKWTENMAGFTVTSNASWLHVACAPADVTLSNGCRTTASGSFIRQINYDASGSCSLRTGVVTVSLGGAVLTATFVQGTCAPDDMQPSQAAVDRDTGQKESPPVGNGRLWVLPEDLWSRQSDLN